MLCKHDEGIWDRLLFGCHSTLPSSRARLSEPQYRWGPSGCSSSMKERGLLVAFCGLKKGRSCSTEERKEEMIGK